MSYNNLSEGSAYNIKQKAVLSTRLCAVSTIAEKEQRSMSYITDSVSPSQEASVKNVSDWYTLKPHEFIEILFGEIPNGFVEVAYLAPESANLYPRTIVHWAELPLGELNPELPNIMELNAKGYNAYFAVAARGRKYEPETRISEKTGKPYTVHLRGKAYDATWITALWVDIDNPGEAGYRQLIDSMLPPSIIVSSGGGWHGYWLLSEPLAVDESNRESIKRTLKGMAIACGGDTKVADLARIMRLPGTVNTKPGRGQTCVVHDFIPGRYYYTDMELHYAPLAAPVMPTITRVISIDASAGMPRWVETYLNSGAVSGERNNTAYAAARALLDNGFSMNETERLIRNRALSDGLSDQEINILLSSADHAPRSAPNLERGIGNSIAADDHLLRFKKGRAS
jgi:RepB DNA-primase from phage plasmid